MKKFIIVCLSCMLLSFAAGCGNNDDMSSIMGGVSSSVNSGGAPGTESNITPGTESRGTVSGNMSEGLQSGETASKGNTVSKTGIGSDFAAAAMPKTQTTMEKNGFNKAALEGLDSAKKGYGQGTNVDDKKRPTGATMLQKQFEKYDALFIAPESNNIYLTFDEGYENGYT